MTRWVVLPVGAALAPALPPRTLHPDLAAVGMNLFPDGAFVQLELARGGGRYLCAYPDSMAVCLLPLGRVPFEATVWRVHLCRREQGIAFLMLQGAAYGRYFGGVSVSQHIWHASQCSYDGEDAHEIMWEPMPVRRGLHILLHNVRYGRLLPTSHRVSMMHWKVHLVPASPTPPALPRTPTEPSNVGSFGDSFRLLQRTIRFVCADSEGCYPNKWLEFTFEGCSIISLRARIADLLGTPLGIILCVHAGSFGRLTPLVSNLPRNRETMDIVVLHASSPATARLRYPEKDPPTP
ncbi:uncharacterized protein LOC110430925 [Sorghum bicolor]|nr:uncharacterized protein LOC110430925 [Sorghum bicolor]XP_021304828.1 uncharacterized protein LOC110430925 [Sorghum bicolor]|eukprot:XP_021304827.1 uncharacterized protein LOC110430925 [Sorghum bicolor]